jgi:membrane-associated phospholipid phosphatase
MRGSLPGQKLRLFPKNLFGRLLTFWAKHRRLILLVLITSILAFLVTSLSDETRQNVLTGLFAHRVLVILLLFFNLLTLSLLFSAGQSLDTWVFLLFNLRGHHPLWLDRVMWGFTQIGNGLAGILLGILLYFAGLRRFAIELLLGILSLWLVVELLKALIERSRPFLTLEGARIIGWREIGSSFPSGHTSQAFYMMTLIALHFQVSPLAGGIMYATAAGVAFTRIYVGAHYPRDVIGGAILGSVWGILTGLIEAYLSTGQF